MQTMMKHLCPCSPWWYMREHGETSSRACGCLKQAVTLEHWSRLLEESGDHGKSSPHWSRFAGRTFDPMEDPRWSSLFLRNCTPWKGHMLEQFVKKCSSWEELILEKFMEDYCLWERSHGGAGEDYEDGSDRAALVGTHTQPGPTWWSHITLVFADTGLIRVTEFHWVSYDRLGQIPNNHKVQRQRNNSLEEHDCGQHCEDLYAHCNFCIVIADHTRFAKK
ncbi:hypothetical protein HGM15179_009029 [Zosterops borbonicus]|uniref:Uncharacterized protein n=1 Tax=Zosterops borbonicus TaxID=364589 RepID=A0A8K1GFX0_9PASS|nr:hypothetical protein HGM15179_009029 [Zosterops borbonicus]